MQVTTRSTGRRFGGLNVPQSAACLTWQSARERGVAEDLLRPVGLGKVRFSTGGGFEGSGALWEGTWRPSWRSKWRPSAPWQSNLAPKCASAARCGAQGTLDSTTWRPSVHLQLFRTGEDPKHLARTLG